VPPADGSSQDFDIDISVGGTDAGELTDILP
jgi:hypothetical protein